MIPNRTKQLSTVALVTCIVVTRVKPVVRMRVGSGQIVELSMVCLFFEYFFTFNSISGTLAQRKKKLENRLTTEN